MAPGFACFATSVITASKEAMSVALPAPMPLAFVGVLTATSTRSASPMHLPTSVEKKRFGSLEGTVISAAGVSHWLPHSDVSLADNSVGRAGAFENEVCRAPSLATRTTSRSWGS